MQRITRLFFLAALLLVLWPGHAQAQSCSATVTDVDFGKPNLLSTQPTDALANLTITCTHISPSTSIKMCPSLGEGSAGSSGSARLLQSAMTGRALIYQLYQDPNRTQGWGAIDETQLGTIPLILLSGDSSKTATATLTIYARLFGSQTAPPAADYVSTFAGGEVAFTYSTFRSGMSGSCAGFVGASVIRPTFDVVAAPESYCTVTANDLIFGSVGILQNPIYAQTSLKVACTQQTPFAVSLDGGLANAAPTARRLSSPAGDTIIYGLYRNSTYSLAWGDDSTSRSSGVGTGAEQTFTIYGFIPAQTTPQPGTYSDRIVATVIY